MYVCVTTRCVWFLMLAAASAVVLMVFFRCKPLMSAETDLWTHADPFPPTKALWPKKKKQAPHSFPLHWHSGAAAEGCGEKKRSTARPKKFKKTSSGTNCSSKSNACKCAHQEDDLAVFCKFAAYFASISIVKKKIAVLKHQVWTWQSMNCRLVSWHL